MTPDYSLTPSPDSPTPRTDANCYKCPLTGRERVEPHFARQLERENAALVKTQEKLKEAESQLQSAKFMDQWGWMKKCLALQAHVEKIHQAVAEWDGGGAGSACRALMRIKSALSSQPELPLIEEVREAAEETATIFDELDTVQWDENGCPVTYHGTQEKIIKLLTHLNPRK